MAVYSGSIADDEFILEDAEADDAFDGGDGFDTITIQPSLDQSDTVTWTDSNTFNSIERVRIGDSDHDRIELRLDFTGNPLVTGEAELVTGTTPVSVVFRRIDEGDFTIPTLNLVGWDPQDASNLIELRADPFPSGSVTLRANEANDAIQLLQGGRGDDTLIGHSGPNIFESSYGSDEFFGLGGDDVFRLTSIVSGRDHPIGLIDGGAGEDLIEVGYYGPSDNPPEIRNVEHITFTESFDGWLMSSLYTSIHGDFIRNMNVVGEHLGRMRLNLDDRDDFDASTITFNDATINGQTYEAHANFELFIDGNDNDNVLIGAASGGGLWGYEGNDTLTGSDGDDYISGGEGDDIIQGGEGGDRVFGGSGDDFVFAGPDVEMIDGGDGNDTVSYEHFSYGVSIDLEALVSISSNGNIYEGLGPGLSPLLSFEKAIGSPHDDNLEGSPRADVLSGAGGNDYLEGEEGADHLEGGEGDDYLQGGEGADRLEGGIGNDILFGGEGSDTLIGGDGDDLFGSYRSSSEVLDKEVSAEDIVEGGDGFDTVAFDFSDQSRDFTIDLVTQQFVGVSWSSIENVSGDFGSGNDTIAFGSQYSDLSGGWPVVVDGGDGVDTARLDFRAASASGEDITALEIRGLDAASQWITYDFGAASDFIYLKTFENIEAFGTSARDVLIWTVGSAELHAEGGDDYIRTGDSDDTLFGGDGRDLILGAGGNDEIFGDAGHDRLEGQNGNDELFGGLGDDSISGGEGDDLVWGGQGNDGLGGGPGDDVIDGGEGIDRAFYTLWDRAEVNIVQTSLGVFSIEAPDGTDTLSNVEFVWVNGASIRLLPGTGEQVDFTADPASFMAAIRDFDGNDLGGVDSWVRIGEADLNGADGTEQIFVNAELGRWASVGVAEDGLVYFNDYSWAGETRVVGIYIDPLVASGDVVAGSDFDSQRRFQNDLEIGNIAGILGADDYDGDGLQEVYFALTDGTAYLHAYMHADGNIQYANYQSQQQVIDFLEGNGFGLETYGDWFG